MRGGMNCDSPTLASPSATAEALWCQIEENTREACLLRQEGREAEAVALLQGRLPSIIRAWSNASGHSPEACRERLRTFFQEQQERVRCAALQRKLIVDEVCSRLKVSARASRVAAPVSMGSTPGPVQLRRRVAIDDVVGMLDALREAEESATAEALLPARELIPSLSSELFAAARH